MPESKSEKRVFTAKRLDGSKVVLSVRTPTEKEEAALKKTYSLSMNDSLISGLPTRAIMLKRLEQAGQWTKADQEDLRTLLSTYQDADKAAEAVTKDTPDDEAQKLYDARDAALEAFNSKQNDINEMLSYTANAIAEAKSTKFIICCVTEYAEANGGIKIGDRLWPDVKAYDADQDGVLEQRVKYEWQALRNGVPSEWEEGEAKAKAELDRLAGDDGSEADDEQVSLVDKEDLVGDVAGTGETAPVVVTETAPVVPVVTETPMAPAPEAATAA